MKPKGEKNMAMYNFRKLLSITTSFVLICSSLAGAGISASADDSSTPAAQTAESTKPVSVIVRLRSDALLEGGLTPGELLTPEAAARNEEIRAEQDAVIAQLREWDAALEPEYRYSVLTNAFSCTLPANLIADVEALPAVRSVTKSYQITAKQAAVSGDLSVNAYPFFEQTGCRGEGQVIAIIDSELDVNHPMFAPLDNDIDVKLTEEDVLTVADTIGLNIETDRDKLYRSSKVPFAADYIFGEEENVSYYDEAVYHGTHVAGIAAGNVFQNEEGQTFSGIAPDAQIVFFGFGAGYELSDMIAAIEDAVKLQSDVINMSEGSIDEVLTEDDPFRDAVNTAEAAGITVCTSAGNNARGDGYNQQRDALDRFGVLPAAIRQARNHINVLTFERDIIRRERRFRRLYGLLGLSLRGYGLRSQSRRLFLLLCPLLFQDILLLLRLRLLYSLLLRYRLRYGRGCSGFGLRYILLRRNRQCFAQTVQ